MAFLRLFAIRLAGFAPFVPRPGREARGSPTTAASIETTGGNPPMTRVHDAPPSAEPKSWPLRVPK